LRELPPPGIGDLGHDLSSDADGVAEVVPHRAFDGWRQARCVGEEPSARTRGRLDGVDKFEPVSGCGDMDHTEEAFGELVVSGGDGSVDFQAAEEALDVITFLVERPVIFDFDPAV